MPIQQEPPLATLAARVGPPLASAPGFAASPALVALLGLALAGAGPAQDTSWTTLSPPGGVHAGALQPSHTLIVYRDGLYMRVYSAITRKWYAHQPSFGTTLQVRSNLVAVPESDRWTAFSPWRGTFAVLLINLATTTWSASESLFAVRDGGTAHVFSPWTGQWHSHAVPASWFMTVGERIVTFGDNNNPSSGAALFDGFNGTWLDIAGRNERLGVGTNGGTAVFSFASATLLYSAQRPSLVTLPVPANVDGFNFANDNASDLVNRGGAAYSGVTGGWGAPPYPLQPVFGNHPGYRINGLTVLAGLNAYQPYVFGMGNAWLPLQVDPLNYRPLAISVTLALVGNGNDVHAFSACTDSISVRTFSGPPTSFGVQWNDHVAAVSDPTTGLPSLFSGITGQWYSAPPGTIPGVLVGHTGALLRTNTGLVAFSAQTGTFVPLNGPGLTPVAGPSCALGATDATNLYAFDTGKAQWLQMPLQVTAGPFVSMVGSPATTLLAQDATSAVGFAARTGRLEALQLAEPASGGVMGDLAWVQTASSIHAFSGFGDVVAWLGHPYDLVGCGRGTILQHQLRLGAGDVALLGIGPRASAPVALPPLGLVWLDLSYSSVRFFAGTPGEDRVLLSLPIPDNPALRNSEWFLQPLMVPASAAPYMSDPIPLRVL